MALTIISTDTVVSGIAFSYSANGDDLYVKEGVLLASTDSEGVRVNFFSDTTTQIDGTLVSAFRAYETFGLVSRLVIGATGSVRSFNNTSTDAGILFFEGFGSLVNHGEIDTPETIAAYFGGSEAEVLNTGSVTGTTGVQFAGGSNTRLMNTGTIFANGNFDGTIDSYEGRGVYLQKNGWLHNSATGVIGSMASGGSGILLSDSSGGSVIENFGQITAGFGTGIDLRGVYLGEGLIRVTNAGLVTGTVASLTGSINADSVTNRGTLLGSVGMGVGNDTLDNRGGTIDGDVVLGDGNDLFDNRGGAVIGSMDGGLGNDTFRMGVGIETIDGGTGIDTIDFRGTAAVVVSLDDSVPATGSAAGDEYVGIELVFGSYFGDVLIGSTLANTLRGYGGNDTMDGGLGADKMVGGRGVDVLTGGAGSDVFMFDALTELGDTIMDFGSVTGNHDLFNIRASAFGGGLVVGTLAAADFQTRADNVAQDASDRFIFRTTDRSLWFDADGNGAGAAVMVADLQASAVVDRSDIVII
jgi:Ca2+-binding RTX toxin-like protein